MSKNKNRSIHLLNDSVKKDFLNIEQEIRKENPLVDTTKCNVYDASYLLFSEELELPKEFGEDSIKYFKEKFDRDLGNRNFENWGGSYVFNWPTGKAMLVLNDFINHGKKETIEHEGKHIYLLRKLRRSNATYDEHLGEAICFAGAHNPPNMSMYEEDGMSSAVFRSISDSVNSAIKKYPAGVIEVLAKDAMILGKTNEEKRKLFNSYLDEYELSITHFYKSLFQ